MVFSTTSLKWINYGLKISELILLFLFRGLNYGEKGLETTQNDKKINLLS